MKNIHTTARALPRSTKQRHEDAVPIGLPSGEDFGGDAKPSESESASTDMPTTTNLENKLDKILDQQEEHTSFLQKIFEFVQFIPVVLHGSG